MPGVSTIIIQSDNGDYVKYEPHELPDGCIVNLISKENEKSKTHSIDVIGKKLASLVCSDNGFNVRVQAIVDKDGNLTHFPRWMATDKKGRSYIYSTLPSYHHGNDWWIGESNSAKCIGSDNFFGQTWKDEPCIVWELIK
jgi:hypothetical protein